MYQKKQEKIRLKIYPENPAMSHHLKEIVLYIVRDATLKLVLELFSNLAKHG